MKKNTIEILSFKIDDTKFPVIDFEVYCSKGTYIRSLANDYGKACGTTASLVCLRRISSGEFHIENAKSINETIGIIQNTPIEIEG